MSTADWVAKYTKNEGVHGIFRNMCASVFAVSSEELPAKVFLTYFTRKSAFKRFGFHPEGSIGVWRSLVNSVESNGGQVWLSSTVESITTVQGSVTGVLVDRAGTQVTIEAPIVISDAGPAATLGLVGTDNLPIEYVDTVKRGDRPCSMIAVNFASQERLVEVPGMLSFAKSRRLAYIANFTDVCPEMAPEDGTCTSAEQSRILRSEISTNHPRSNWSWTISETPSPDLIARHAFSPRMSLVTVGHRSAQLRDSTYQTPHRSKACGTSETA